MIRGVAQPGSASALGAEGRVFESLRPDHKKMNYIIYKNKKTPTQSGDKNEKFWVLEKNIEKVFEEDPLTGWKGSTTGNFLKLKFNSKQEAINYANKNNLDYDIIEETVKKFRHKSYADNFKYKRIRTDI